MPDVVVSEPAVKEKWINPQGIVYFTAQGCEWTTSTDC